jgi:hypothetical protein
MNYRLIFCLLLIVAMVGVVSADTLLKYLDEDTGDRYLRGGLDAHESFTTIRNGVGSASGDFAYSVDGPYIYKSSPPPQYYRMQRLGYGFNTSLVGSGSTVTAVIFGIMCYSKFNNAGGYENLTISGFTPGTPVNFQTSDFNKVTDTRLATDIAYNDSHCSYGDAYNNFTFNSDGLSAINKTGYTNFAVRMESDMINSSAMHTTGDQMNRYRIYDYQDSAGKYPFMQIVYTPGGGGAAPVASFTCTKNFLRIPNSVTCTDSSTNTPTSWSWDMGDGSAAKTTQNVTYPYMKRGIWGITLNATNAVGSNVTPSASNVRVTGYENNG